MKDETRIWLQYANENFKSANVLLNSGLLNPCLHNTQQAAEKALKAVLMEHALPLKKTHSINELVMILRGNGFDVDIDEDESDLLDSIYLPSKYPLGSALPDYEPTVEICKKCISVADRVMISVKQFLQ